ncbi:GNAT family N-acetyltransferase [Catenuloplanes sp. NPDC051500]|uniref:GNAT family N-acetyltransferase n=1 Tax=Catenuloplanes sp. NPDC051500 TaxID=3363959 RepID=UPI0037ADE295
MTYTVSDLVEKERFEARDEAGELAGMLTYQVTGPIIVCTHTGVEPGFDAAAVTDALARAIMEDAKARNRTVVPMCPMLSEWLDKHREYEKLVARSTRRVK